MILKKYQYRPDIDGLRALAVSMVVLFHAFPTVIPGGYIGVDIFFVISGFLITGIILRESQTNFFSFVEFYARRCRRIVPSLFLVILSVWLVSWFILLPEEFKNLGKHLIAASTFTSNILLWREAGYFDTAAELKPLLHLWSLGIEEQFYLLSPPHYRSSLSEKLQFTKSYCDTCHVFIHCQCKHDFQSCNC